MEDYQDRLQIATPEGVTVDLVLAGVGSRFVALIVDLVLQGVLLLGAWLLAVWLIGGDAAIAVGAVASFATLFGYDVAFEVFNGGRTPGKRLTGLRVLRDDGRPVDLLSSAIRNIVRLLEGGLLYAPAIVSVLVTARNQRLGDLAARTIVARDAPRAKQGAAGPAVGLGLPGALPQDFNNGWAMPAGAQRPYAPGGGPLDVSAVTAEDVAAIRAFLGRRADLPPAARGEIARTMAAALAPRVGGATGGLGAEALLEAVAAAKAREHAR